LRGEIGLRRFLRNSPYLNAEAAPPFCHSSWEDKHTVTLEFISNNVALGFIPNKKNIPSKRLLV